MTDQTNETSSRARRWTRRAWLAAGLLALGAVGVGSWFAATPAAALGLFGPATRLGGWFGHHGQRGHHGPHEFTAEEIRGHVEWLLHGIDATDAQVSQIASIAASAAADLRGLHDAHGGAREVLTSALVGPSIDRAALEQLRSEHLAAADTASRRLAQALADAAEVLTPEQRAELAAQHARFHGHHED